MEASFGIDFGTTNSTACLFDGTDYHFADLEDGKHTIPSLMYVDKGYYPTYGESARTRFLNDNLDRRITLEKTDLGYIQITLGDNAFESFDHTGFSPAPTTIDAKISALTDQNLPGFLFASTKRLLGQMGINSVMVFDKNIKMEAVVSSIIQNIKAKTCKEYPGLMPSHICVGRPVNYECSNEQKQNEANLLAVERMGKALKHAGISEYDFFLEPIAPVLAHIHENDEERNQNILVLDFGGGTLDFSLLKKSDKQLQVVGNFGRSLGGDIITELLIRDYIFPEMGLSKKKLIELKSKLNYLEDIVPDILNWRTTYILNQPKYFALIADAMKLLPHDAVNLNRIRLLIIQNFSYNVFFAAEKAKKRLTESPEAEIDLHPIGIAFTLSRSDLEKSMQNYLDLVASSINSFCFEHGFNTDRIGRVLLTGGTSLIPCIKQRITDLFPDKVVSIDPFLSIVKGFALGAWLYNQKKISLSGDQIKIDMK